MIEKEYIEREAAQKVLADDYVIMLQNRLIQYPLPMCRRLSGVKIVFLANMTMI